MSKLIVPKNYEPILDPTETQKAIKRIKDFFQKELAHDLNLARVSAPLFVFPETGLNDNLTGKERRVEFTIKDIDEKKVEVVQSLAKWKRNALGRYGMQPGQGLYTDMDAIRRDEELDNIHSIYVDQWDWERVITADQRNNKYLEHTVKIIYRCMLELGDYVNDFYPELEIDMPDRIKFIDSQELEDAYPGKTSKERERLAAEDYGAIFIKRIGCKLNSGQPHDLRSPDYDDWELNGDILLYYPVLDRAFEISSMGIRVDKESLLRQLKAEHAENRLNLDFHRKLVDGTLPQSIGGGIGQSRLCMYLLEKGHIGEVQASVWPASQYEYCKQRGI